MSHLLVYDRGICTYVVNLYSKAFGKSLALVVTSRIKYLSPGWAERLQATDDARIRSLASFIAPGRQNIQDQTGVDIKHESTFLYNLLL